MNLTQVAEALYQVRKASATGWLTIHGAGRASRLGFRGGDLVAADLARPSVGTLQTLLLTGRLSPQQLDALWARKHMRMRESELLQEAGVSEGDAASARLLLVARRLAALATGVEFHLEDVAPSEGRVSGAAVVRAAIEAGGAPQDADRVYRCVRPERLSEWAPGEELQLLELFREFRSAAGLTDVSRALVQLLTRDGVLEEATPPSVSLVGERADAWVAEITHVSPAPASAVPPVLRPRHPGGAGAGDLDDLSFEDELFVPDEVPARKAPPSRSAPPGLNPARPSAAVTAPPTPRSPASFDDQSFEEALSSVRASLEHLSAQGEPRALGDDNAPPARETWGGSDEELLAQDPRNLSEEARLRRQRLLRRAMENIGGIPPPGQRAQTLAPTAAAAQEDPSGAGPSASPAVSAASAAPAVADPVAPDEARLAEQIESKHRELTGSKTHYEVLGLAPEASREQVKTAFLNLAKTFHPDRLPPSLQSLSAKMNAVFERIRTAYDVLFDDTQRGAYLAALARARDVAAATKNAADPAAAAAELFQKGDAALRRRDYLAAEELCAQAHALAPKSVYLSTAAWALYLDPLRKSEAARARQMMTEALRLDATNDRVHYQLGVIARVDGDIDRAERLFREAVKLNPKHAEAGQELRLIGMQRQRSSKKGIFR